MRQTLTISLIAIFLLSHLPQARCQDVKRDTNKNKKAATADDEDNEDDAPQDAPKKKKSHKKVVDPPVAFGIHGGLNDANMLFAGTATGAKVGFVLGGIMDVHVGGVVHLETGLMYALNGASNVTYLENYSQPFGSTYTWNVNTLELPINLEFKFGKPNKARFCVGLGGYIAYNLSGSMSPDEGDGTLKIGSAQTDALRPLDLGVGLDLALQLHSGLFFRIRGQGGISDLQPQRQSVGFTSTETTIRTSSTVFEIGYFFLQKKVKHPVKGKDDDYLEPKM